VSTETHVSSVLQLPIKVTFQALNNSLVQLEQLLAARKPAESLDSCGEQQAPPGFGSPVWLALSFVFDSLGLGKSLDQHLKTFRSYLIAQDLSHREHLVIECIRIVVFHEGFYAFDLHLVQLFEEFELGSGQPLLSIRLSASGGHPAHVNHKVSTFASASDLQESSVRQILFLA